MIKIINLRKTQPEIVHVEDMWIGRLNENLKSAGYKIASAKEVAEAQISIIDRTGRHLHIPYIPPGFVKEGIIHSSRNVYHLTHISPLINNAREVDKIVSSRWDHHLYLNQEQLEQALVGSIELKNHQNSIPTARFGEDEITNYLFGETAQKYGELIKEKGQAEMDIFCSEYGFGKNSAFYEPMLNEPYAELCSFSPHDATISHDLSAKGTNFFCIRDKKT